jgi:hypothetical protein
VSDAKPKDHKKKRFKKRYWLLIDLAIAAVILVLMLYRPSRYGVPVVTPGKLEQGEIHPYLTHDLLPQLHNGAQSGEPFDLVVLQKPINEAIAQCEWPIESDGVRLYPPVVSFEPRRIALMAGVDMKGVELVVTAVVEPELDARDLLNLRVAKVKVGAMNITPLARFIAKRMYKQHLELWPIDTEDLRTKIAGSLLNDEPFEPVFDIRDFFEDGRQKLRVEKVTIEQGKVTIRLAPAS